MKTIPLDDLIPIMNLSIMDEPRDVCMWITCCCCCPHFYISSLGFIFSFTLYVYFRKLQILKALVCFIFWLCHARLRMQVFSTFQEEFWLLGILIHNLLLLLQFRNQININFTIDHESWRFFRSQSLSCWIYSKYWLVYSNHVLLCWRYLVWPHSGWCCQIKTWINLVSIPKIRTKWL